MHFGWSLRCSHDPFPPLTGFEEQHSDYLGLGCGWMLCLPLVVECRCDEPVESHFD